MPDIVSSPELPQESNTALNRSSLKNPIMRIAIIVLIVGISIMLVVRKNKTFIPSKTSLTQPFSSEPTITPTSLPENWQTYTNSNYGFETKYDPASAPTETIGGETAGQFARLLTVKFGTIPLKSPHGYELTVSQQSLEDFRSELVGHVTDKVEKEEKIIINGNTWTKINYKVFLTTDYVPITTAVINYARYSYSITASPAVTDRILSTFKFLDPNVSEDQISNCQTNSDCIVVPYSHCCGQSKRAINKKYKLLYESHAEWQKFDNPEVCSRIGICPRDSHVTETVCNQDKHCELVY